ncbi:hypothetical protein [Nocardia brasiliensis]|uniref:hypothetical protein n=1 Tax=Nocardia brasiliensis TaxID=37326 RepID=UPI00245608B4|nr:hypothetical protein [Nocardia brasiliensis]
MCTLCEDDHCLTRFNATPRPKVSRILGTWNEEDYEAPTLSDLLEDAKPASVEQSELDDAAWFIGFDRLKSKPNPPIRWRIAGPLEFPEYCFGDKPGVVVGPIPTAWELAAFAERLMTGHEHDDGGTIAECLTGARALRLEQHCWFLPNLRVMGPVQERTTPTGHVYQIREDLPAPPPPRL